MNKDDKIYLKNFELNIEDSEPRIKCLNDNLDIKNNNNQNYLTLKEILIYLINFDLFFEKNMLVGLENKSLEEEEPKNFFVLYIY